MIFMMVPDDQRVDKETFRQIFLDHWDGFKTAYPSYDTAQYEEAVQKMLECGSEMGGYTEYICMHCGQDRRKVPFTCKVILVKVKRIFGLCYAKKFSLDFYFNCFFSKS